MEVPNTAKDQVIQIAVLEKLSSTVQTSSTSTVISTASPDHKQSLIRRKSSATRSEPINNSEKPPSSTSERNKDEDDDEEEEHEDIIGKLKAILFMLELSTFISIMGLLISSLTLNKLQNFVILDLKLWKWCLLALVILSGRLLSRWLINILVFLIEKSFLLKQNVLYFVYGLRTSASVFIWLTWVLLAWIFLFDHGVKRSKETRKFLHDVTRTLASSLAGTALWLVKTFSVKLIAVHFQSKRFFDRIQESIFHQFVLRTLSSSPGESDKKIWTVLRFITKILKVKDDPEKGNKNKTRKENISSWTMKDLKCFISASNLSILNELDEQEDEIQRKSEAEVVADRIIENVAADSQNEFIGNEQLLHSLQGNKKHLKKMLKQFEEAEKIGKISKSDFKKWVITVYKDRENLKRSLNDAKTAIEELNRILSGFVLVAMIIVWLLVMGLLTSKIMLIITSQVILVAFIFGNAAKTCFEAIIFVFVTHPFDIGDRCVIDGVQMIVDEMNILTTIFLRYDKERIYYPNSVLVTKPISNFYRSPEEMGDSVEFAIDVYTSTEIIDKLKSEIKKYLKRNNKHWSEDHSVVVKDIEDVNKMRMALYVTHTINFQEYGDKLKRRSDLVLELKKIFENLGIKYNLLPQEVRLCYTNTPPARS